MSERPALTREPGSMPPRPAFRHVRRGARRHPDIGRQLVEENELRRHYFGSPWPRCEPPCPECP